MPDWKAMIGYKSLTDLQADAKAQLAAAGSRITNLNQGGVLWAILNAMLWVASKLHDLLLAIVPQGFAGTATGSWLDAKVAEAQLTRKAATYAAGNATFYRAATVGALTIRQGVLWRATNGSGQGVRFIVTADTVMPAGTASATVPCVAEFPGSAANLATNSPVQLMTSVPGVDGVRLDAGWLTTSGADKETDDQLRTRYQLAWSTLAVGNTADKYLAWVLEVAGVTGGWVNATHPRGQGTVDAYAFGSNGAPDAALLTAVQTHLDQVKLNDDDVLAKAPTVKAVDVTLTLTIPANQGDIPTVKAQATKSVNAVFVKDISTSITPLRIGDGLYLSRLVDVTFVSPVIDAKVTLPAADVAAVAGQLIILGVLTVNVVRAA